VLAPKAPEIDRERWIREAFRLESLTIAWMTVEAVVALASAWTAGSILLAAFGLDSLIELASAGVLVWRLSVELRHGEEFSEATERLASRIAGSLLFVLAAYVVIAAGWSLPFRPCGTWRCARSLSRRKLEVAPCGPTPWKP
jgi:hypothetical protein